MDVCRQIGVSDASFYLWKKKSSSLGMTEIRELHQLRDKKARLKHLVAAEAGQAHPGGRRLEKL